MRSSSETYEQGWDWRVVSEVVDLSQELSVPICTRLQCDVVKPDRNLKLPSSVTTDDFAVRMGKCDQCVRRIPTVETILGTCPDGPWVEGRNTNPQWRPTRMNR